jgi:hypothetical protein
VFCPRLVPDAGQARELSTRQHVGQLGRPFDRPRVRLAVNDQRRYVQPAARLDQRFRVLGVHLRADAEVRLVVDLEALVQPTLGELQSNPTVSEVLDLRLAAWPCSP